LVDGEPGILLNPTNVGNGGWEVRLDSTHFADSLNAGNPKVSMKLRLGIQVTPPGGGEPVGSTIDSTPVERNVFNRLFAMSTQETSTGYTPYYSTDYPAVASEISLDALLTSTLAGFSCTKVTNGDPSNQSDVNVLDSMTTASLYVFATHGAPGKFWPSHFYYGNSNIALTGTVSGGEGQNPTWSRIAISSRINNRQGMPLVPNEPNLFLMYACSTLSGSTDLPEGAKLLANGTGRAYAGFAYDVYSTVGFNSLPSTYGLVDPSKHLTLHYQRLKDRLIAGETLERAVLQANSLYRPFTCASSSPNSNTQISSNPLLVVGDQRFTARGIYLSNSNESSLFSTTHPSIWYWVYPSSRP